MRADVGVRVSDMFPTMGKRTATSTYRRTVIASTLLIAGLLVAGCAASSAPVAKEVVAEASPTPSAATPSPKPTRTPPPDTDGDGVIDSNDDFPADPAR